VIGSGKRPVTALNARQASMTRGRSHAGVEADTAEVVGNEIGRRAALRLIGWIG
jgi:hypothetical protein